MLIENEKFNKRDLDYYFKERKTDFSRLAIIYLTIKEDAKRSKIFKSDGKIETGLNLVKIHEKTGLGPSLIVKKLKELNDLGIIEYDRFGTQIRIYFNPKNENCSYLDKLIEKTNE
ncbi:MAG: hypothetical protein QXD55_00640 [Candidatus Aenigmatarchaeota archaeon]